MADDLSTRDAKLIQYLNEAYGKEKELETALQAHIKMAKRPPYKKRLQDHLKETKAQVKGLERRIKALGDKETEKLAREHRRQEERMANFLLKLIPQLAKAVVTEEVPAAERRKPSSSSRSRGTRAASSRSSGSSRSSAASRSRSSGSPRSGGSSRSSGGSRSGGTSSRASRSRSSRASSS